MPWWDQILDLVKREFSDEGPLPSQPVPSESVHAAQTLLKRSVRDLAAAKAQAEAARRRMQRAQNELEKLVTDESKSSGFKERLALLAESVAHESQLISSFDQHINNLSQVQARVAHEYERLQRDLDMVERVHAAAVTSQHVRSQPAPSHKAPQGRTKALDQAAEKLGKQLDHLPPQSETATASPGKAKKGKARGRS